jgi:uncharacterized protein (DUF58 family)
MLARTDRLYVKQFEEETNLRAQIILDASGSMLYRHEAGITKLEYGAYLAAVLGYVMTRQQDAVGLTTFDTELRLDMPPRASDRHFGEMMRQLEGTVAALERAAKSTGSAGPGTKLADTLHRLAARFKRRGLIVLISDLYDDPEGVIRALHHFRSRRHEVLLFHVFDRAEIEFPFRETMQFVDLETGERLQIDPAYVRDEYRRQIAAYIDRFRGACNDCQIDYVLTDTSTPYDLMLSRYLARRRAM